jgi:uncharacterized phage infection (PIP) family protein YhgE
MSVISTDLNIYVGNLMANVIRGSKNIDNDWNKIQEDLRRMNVRKYVETLQAGYDAFIA